MFQKKVKAFATAALLLTAASGPALAEDVSAAIDADGGVFVIATFTVKPEKEADFVAIMKQVVIDTRNEEGNVDYRLHAVPAKPHTYVTYEVFRDQAAADAHNASDHIKAIVPPLLQTLDGDIAVQAMQIVK